MDEQTTLSSDEQTIERLRKMAKEDARSLSNFMTILINREWLTRHPEDIKLPIQEELERR